MRSCLCSKKSNVNVFEACTIFRGVAKFSTFFGDIYDDNVHQGSWDPPLQNLHTCFIIWRGIPHHKLQCIVMGFPQPMEGGYIGILQPNSVINCVCLFFYPADQKMIDL